MNFGQFCDFWSTLEHWINAYDKDLHMFTLSQVWYRVDLFLFPPPTPTIKIPSQLRTDIATLT